jgi:protein subunit release factor A
LERVMEGELDEVVDALITHYQAEVLRATGSTEHNGKSGNRGD